MIFLKESLYGWGVCHIPQPRATQDIYVDRRKKPAATVRDDRRRLQPSVGFLGVWSLLARRDLPFTQVFTVLALSLSLIILFGLTSLYLPVAEKAEIPPLEIVAMVLEEPIAVPDPVPSPPVPRAFERPEPRPEPAPMPRAKSVEKPPVVAVPLPPQTVKTPPAKVVVMPEKTVREPVLPGPRAMERQYKASAPTAGPLPAGKPLADLRTERRVEPLVAATAPGNRYSRKQNVTSSPMPAYGRSTLTTGTTTEVDLPTGGVAAKNFKISRAQQSLRGTGSAKTFVPASNGSDVQIRGAAGVAKSVGDSDVIGNTGSIPATAFRSVGERVGILGGNEDVDIPVLAGAGKASGAIGGTENSDSTPSGDGTLSGSVNFSGVGDGDYDPARMISLNQLKACIDPDAEWKLKTTLATALDTEGKCSLRNMVFFFMNPENSYTLQVNVYNPENFVDRCEALRAAIQCVNP